MSGLDSILDAHDREQRSEALRGLLARPLVTALESPELFARIVRHQRWLIDWFGDHPGWKLVVAPDSGFARLHKVPARPDATRPAALPGRPAFDRRRYALVCLALAALDDCAGQTTLARLASAVAELSSEDGLDPFDPTLLPERRAFVDALRLLAGFGVLRLRDGDAERYAQSTEGDALYDVDERLLGQLLAAPVPPAFAGSPERMLAEPLPDTEEGERVGARQHVVRRLLEEPVVYYDELDPKVRDWLDHSRGFLYRLLSEDVGMAVERRREGLAAVDPTGATSDTLFPDGGSTAKHAALLLAEQLASRGERGERPFSREEISGLVAALQADFGEPSGWSRQYPPDAGGAERLAEDALELLERFNLVARDPGGWRARPAIARFRPATPGALSARPRPRRT